MISDYSHNNKWFIIHALHSAYSAECSNYAIQTLTNTPSDESGY